MFINITHEDLREARTRMEGIRKTYPRDDHHNRHNPIAIAIERECPGTTCYVSPTAMHISGPNIDEIIPLSTSGKNYLKLFISGSAFAVERLSVT